LDSPRQFDQRRARPDAVELRALDLVAVSPIAGSYGPDNGEGRSRCPNRAACGDVLMRAALGAATATNVGGAMAQYMLLVYQEEVDPAEQAEREKVTPLLLELHASLREAGLLVGVQRMRSVESATSVRVRDGETEITDGPFAVTKEVLAGYYVLECADLDEALEQAARLPMARWGTVEVRPVVSADEWVNVAQQAGVDLPDEAVNDLA
jgi:hypothetical protein